MTTSTETPDLAELRRLLANIGGHWQEMPSSYPADRCGWEVHELSSPGLGDLDVTGGGLPEGTARLIAAAVNALPTLLDELDELRAEVGVRRDARKGLAHMTEARNNARAEVKRLTAQVERVRALADEWTYNGEFGWDDGSHAYGTDCVVQALDYAAAKLRRALDEEPQS